MSHDHGAHTHGGPGSFGSSGPTETAASIDFLLQHLPAGASVLDVGCGDGSITARLKVAGFSVVGIDADADAVARARQRGVVAEQATWPEFWGPAVDAIVFLRSLHHIESLPDALERAIEVLRPEGMIVVDDFDWSAVDEPTLAWFLETARDLQRRGRIREDSALLSMAGQDDPRSTWRAEYADLHTAAAMDSAIRSRFEVEGIETSAYLYAYFEEALGEGDEAQTEVRRIRDEEIRRGEQGRLTRVGRRWWGRRPRAC